MNDRQLEIEQELAKLRQDVINLGRALVRAHCDLRWYEGYAGKGSVALAENRVVGFTVEWEKSVR